MPPVARPEPAGTAAATTAPRPWAAMPKSPTASRSENGSSTALEAAPDTLPGRDCLSGSDPRGRGRGVRKRARPRTRSRPSDCRVAPSPTLAFPAVPAARQRDSQDLCVQELPPPRRCARPERRGAHRHPMSFSWAYAVLTQGTGGAQIIGRGLPRERGRRGQPSRGDSPGSSSTPPG